MKLMPVLFFVSLISMSCNSGGGKEQGNLVLEMPTPIYPNKELNVAFLVVDGVYNSELVAPMDIFHHTVFHTDQGMKVFTVAPTSELVTTFEGLRIIPDYFYTDEKLPHIDILVVPSAEHSMDSDLENDSMIDFVRQKGRLANYVISLCDGAFVLAKAGLIDGLESTTFPGDIAKYKAMFPKLKVHEGVSFVHHGKLITSAGGAKSYDPAIYLAELLYGNKVAKGLAKGLVIDWDVNNVSKVIVK